MGILRKQKDKEGEKMEEKVIILDLARLHQS